MGQIPTYRIRTGGHIMATSTDVYVKRLKKHLVEINDIAEDIHTDLEYVLTGAEFLSEENFAASIVDKMKRLRKDIRKKVFKD